MLSRFLLLMGLLCCLSCNSTDQKAPVAEAKLNSPAPAPEKAKVIEGDFTHVVLFWLKDPSNETTNKEFAASVERFIKSSAYVKSMHLGTPAQTPREVVDNSYTYCLIVTFDSKEDHDKYQEDPVHKQFLKESKDLWDRVQIFDSINFW